MKICALVDVMGTSIQTQDEEYAEIKERFCAELQLDPGEVTFLTNVMPHNLQNMSTDVYVLDYGGMMPGSEDTTRYIFRETINQIENKPNTLFVIWSSFSFNWYQELIERESPELVAPNVVFAMADNAWNRILKWFGREADMKEGKGK
jgi:hypothetical protein